MQHHTIKFQIESKKRRELDSIATALDRDQSYILNEAIDVYLDVHQWQIAHIREGIRQADAGEFATDAQVAAAFRRRRK